MPAPTLTEAISQYGREAYLLTVGKDGPHTSHVSIDFHDNVIGCAISASAAKNIASEPKVVIVLAAQRARRLRDDRQWDCRGKARADRLNHGRDHVDQVRLPSPRTEVGR